MWSEKQVNFVINILTDEQRNALVKGDKSLYENVLELIKLGQVSIHIDEKIESETPALISKYENQIEGDFLKIDALVCFKIAFEKEIQPRISRQKILTIGTVVFADYLFVNQRRINEQEIQLQLNLAYQYRLKCNFNKCHQILNEIERNLKNSSLKSAQKLLAMVYDLRVDAYHTASQERFQKVATKISTQSINLWFEIKGRTELIHAFLRDAILHRQQYYFNYSKDNLLETIRTLRDAEELGVIRLAEMEGKNDIFTHESICKYYTDSIKGYAQIKDFNKAKKYIQKAEKKCSEVGAYYAPK